MYEPNPSYVRTIEVYKKTHPDVRIYHMVYKDSVEESKYLFDIRREKLAFEKLIAQKATLVLPIDLDGRVNIDVENMYWSNRQEWGARSTRIAGGSEFLLDDRERKVKGKIYSEFYLFFLGYCRC